MYSGTKERSVGSEGGGIKRKKGKERNGSLGNIEDLLKRKRDVIEKNGEEGMDVFKRSNKIVKSPEKGGEEEDEKGELRRLILEMREEVRDMTGKLSVKIKEQGEGIKEEVEELMKNYREQMEKRREEKELREDMEKMKRMEGLEKTIEEWEERGGREHRERNGKESRG